MTATATTRPGSAAGIAGDTDAPSLTAIVLTFNEEIHIERCLGSLKGLVRRLIVVDSFSTDRTVELARAAGAEVVQRAFKHQAEQFQWALDNCGIATEWVLRLDADEYFEPAALADLRVQLATLPAEVTGIEVRRKFIFMGRWIRWGGYYPTILTRVWRTGAARMEQRWMDEHVVLERGRAVRLANGDLVDDNLSGVDAWMAKHNRYATRQMVDFINREHHLFAIDEGVERQGNPGARWKRLLRNRVFGAAPLFVRGIAYFLYRYVLRLGFLDGRQGLVFHTLHALCYFLLIDAKIDEARRMIAAEGVEAFRRHLAQRHKIEI